MKKTLKITGIIFGSIALVVFLIVALLCSWMGQTLIGSVASNYFTKEWGGEVKVSAIRINPLGSLDLYGIKLIDPANDTIFLCQHLSATFVGIPIDKEGLDLNRVELHDAYFHLETDEAGIINLQYIISYFAPNALLDTTQKEVEHFIVRANKLVLKNVEYRMDLGMGLQTPILENCVNYLHQHYYDVNAVIKDIRVDADDINCRIEQFAARERSGFVLKRLSCEAKVSPYGISAKNMELETGNSTLLFDAAMTFNTWEGMADYCNDVEHTLTLKEGCIVGLKDVGHWVPLLWGVRDSVIIGGHAEGSVAQINVDSIGIDIIDRVKMNVAGSISGLPDIATTTMDLNVNIFETSVAKLSKIVLPESVKMKVPAALLPLGDFRSQIKVDGSQLQCKANVDIATTIGDIGCNVNIDYDKEHGEYTAEGQIMSPRLNIGAIVPNEWVTATGLRSDIHCHGTSYSDLSGEIGGELYSTVLRGVPLDNTKFETKLTHNKIGLDLEIDDPLLTLSILGSVENADDGIIYAADAVVENCDLARLHLTENDSIRNLSTHLMAHAVGNSLQDLTGNASLTNTSLVFGSQDLHLNSLILTINEVKQQRSIQLTSDWIDGNVTGYFDYADFGVIARQICDRYLPYYYNPWRSMPQKDTVCDASLSVDLTWRGNHDQLRKIGSNLALSRGTTLNATYNQTMDLRLVMRSDSVSIGSLRLHDIVIVGEGRGDSYRIDGEAVRLCVGTPSLLENVAIGADLSSHETHLTLNSGNSGNTKNVLLALVLTSDEEGNIIHLTDGGFDIAQRRWALSCDDIALRSGVIKVPYLMATDLPQDGSIARDGRPSQTLTINLSIDSESDKEDEMTITMNNISLAWLSNQWLHESGFDIDGRITATVNIKGLDDVPYITADLTVDECEVNEYTLGHLSLSSHGDTKSGRMNIEVDTRTEGNGETFSPLKVKGYVDINDTPKVDADCHFDHFPLEMAAPLLSSFASQFDGMLHGSIHVGDKLEAPSIVGTAIVENGLLKIDATGVAYHFSDTLWLQNKRVMLRQFEVLDPRNNLMDIDGTVTYETLNNPKFDISFETDNFMLFNLPQHADSISGTIFAALQGTLEGDTRHMDINTKATTQHGSTLTVPVDDRRQVTENQYVEFIEPRSKQQSASNGDDHKRRSPLDMNVELDITPDLQLNLPMRFQQVAPSLTARGSGKILLAISHDGDPVINGHYELTTGSLNVELASLYRYRFTLDEGGSIVVPGNINNTQFNISAANMVHANLASLMGDAVEGSGRSVNVETVIHLAGTLTEPTINFDLRFPSSDKSVEDEVWTYIDRSNERDMISQAFSLLLTGRFVNSNSSSGVMDNASAGGVNIMTSALSNLLTGAVGGAIDINIGYQGETELTTEQFDIDLRKEWDKLYFESTLGYGGETRALKSNDATTNIVGDVLVGYKINPRLHVFGFNRTNTNDFTRTELPYRQGLGIKLTREFDNWFDMFKRSK